MNYQTSYEIFVAKLGRVQFIDATDMHVHFSKIWDAEHLEHTPHPISNESC